MLRLSVRYAMAYSQSPKFIALAVLALATAPSAFAQSGPGVDQQLIAADRSYYEALGDAKADMDGLQRLLGTEYIEVNATGVETRDDLLRGVRHVSHLTFDYKDAHAVALSPTSGYVYADVRYTWSFNGSPVTEHKMTTTVFAMRDGRWIATLHTETPVTNSREEILATPEDSNPDLIALRQLEAQVIAQVRIPGYAPFPLYPVALDAGTAVSFSNQHGAHEAVFGTLPPPMQQVWIQWASYTKDEPSGEALFKDMFYRFFFVHELGHLMARRVAQGLPDAEREKVMANAEANLMEGELAANRISVAWFREHDPGYLARLVADFRLIQARLPNPVPQGADPKRYFSENYQKLGADPVAYGWYQLYMVITVCDEAPKTFQQTMNALPALHYDEK
jgi:hypothetical protein